MVNKETFSVGNRFLISETVSFKSDVDKLVHFPFSMLCEMVYNKLTAYWIHNGKLYNSNFLLNDDNPVDPPDGWEDVFTSIGEDRTYRHYIFAHCYIDSEYDSSEYLYLHLYGYDDRTKEEKLVDLINYTTYLYDYYIRKRFEKEANKK